MAIETSKIKSFDQKFCTLRLRWIFIFISRFFLVYYSLRIYCNHLWDHEKNCLLVHLFVRFSIRLWNSTNNDHTQCQLPNHIDLEIFELDSLLSVGIDAAILRNVFTIRQKKKNSIYLRLTVQLVNCNLNWKKHHFIIWSFCRKIEFIDV